MKRREFLLSAVLLPVARRAVAQQAVSKKRMAAVSTTINPEDLKRDPRAIFFMDELKRVGFVEGENLIVDRFSAEGRTDRYDAFAREVVDTHPDIIYTGGAPLTLGFKKATTTIPIVTMTGDPIQFGIVASIARPGGNITGVSVDAGLGIWGKRLQLLHEAVPSIKRVAYVSTAGNWNDRPAQVVRDAAQSLGLSLVSVPLSRPFGEAEYRRAFDTIERGQIDGIMMSDENEHMARGFLIVELVRQLRLPAVFVHRDQAEAGGLMSYSWDFKSAVRRNAMQIAEILRGANPGDIPYFQVSNFELVINLKTARDLGLELPAGLLAGAHFVIE